jgi:hypothetical protein
MRRLRFDGFAVFALFFGVATLQAFHTHDWINVVCWLAMGSGFLLADGLRKRI